MKDEDSMAERKNEMWGSRQASARECLPDFLGARKRGLNAEFAEETQRTLRRKTVELGRRSPPLQTKGGAPSSSHGDGATGVWEERRGEPGGIVELLAGQKPALPRMPIGRLAFPVSGRWRRLRLRLVLLVWRGRGALLRCLGSALLLRGVLLRRRFSGLVRGGPCLFCSGRRPA